MLALAIGGDAISNQERREAIIDGLFDLPSEYQLLPPLIYFLLLFILKDFPLSIYFVAELIWCVMFCFYR